MCREQVTGKRSKISDIECNELLYIIVRGALFWVLMVELAVLSGGVR